MEVMALLFFVGVVFVVGAGLAFAWTAKLGTFDHNERLALLPLEDASPSAPHPPLRSDASETNREDKNANATHRV